ncbi:hypothetical protein GCM10022220_06890 [Actinocatenispora rupis]|uniref:Uncharacterized protein n=1 Tax=Actinocatenispora rupis TaxID=519421 RepID=A0A8J3NA10_9ACTN|nr:hypothetical protein Aru02nite_25050 [Actinocatenispora rupis]
MGTGSGVAAGANGRTGSPKGWAGSPVPNGAPEPGWGANGLGGGAPNDGPANPCPGCCCCPWYAWPDACPGYCCAPGYGWEPGGDDCPEYGGVAWSGKGCIEVG